MSAARQIRRRERDEQAAGVKLLRALGARVYVSGTTRRRGDHPGTMQTPGIPDVEAFLPLRAIGSWTLLKWEVKRAGGHLRPEQLEYRQLCQGASIPHVVGGCNDLIAWLMAEGYLKPGQVPHSRLPTPNLHPSEDLNP